MGRDSEHGRLTAFVEAVPDGGRALLIRGDSGIGKTSLWRWGVHECEAAGFNVLLTRAAEEEMPLGLTGLVDLFERVELDAGALIADDNLFARGRAVLGALLLLGRALLRAGQRTQASDALADARSRFAAMGAALWEARAIEDLERAAPGRSEGALTPAERRIAALVAQGLKNREIGQTLYMSVGTVEAHLTRTYRKLGIRSRSELARRVVEGDAE